MQKIFFYVKYNIFTLRRNLSSFSYSHWRSRVLILYGFVHEKKGFAEVAKNLAKSEK